MLNSIKQFIPEGVCLKCDGCCRFNQNGPPWTPYQKKTIPFKDYFICACFDQQANYCRDYANRLLDCRIYPFILHKKDDKVVLAADLRCPYLNENFKTSSFKEYAQYLRSFLNSEGVKSFLKANPEIIADYDGQIEIISQIDCSGVFGNILSLNDKPLFEKYLALARRELSAFSFANIYAWRSLFEIRYKIIKERLCIFFKDRTGSFMYLAPLGGIIDKETIDECFLIMDSQNKNKQVSRIENVEDENLDFYHSHGFNLIPKDKEYVYLTEELINLSGDGFKDKRASYNYFIKNYKYTYEQLTLDCIYECLSVLADWRQERLARKKIGQNDGEAIFYRGILDDNLLWQEELLLNFSQLSLFGRVIKIEGKARAYTFGFELNNETFCIAAETADLSFKGIAQFLFREFSRDLKKYKYINVMDDSGLTNIRKVKLSYRPHKKIAGFIIKK